MSAAALGLLLWAGAPTTPAARADSTDALVAGATLYGDVREARSGASVLALRTVNLDQIGHRSHDAVHLSFDDEATSLTIRATARVPVQALALAAQYPSDARSTFGLSAPVDAPLSDRLARLHHAFSGDLGLSSDDPRQGGRELPLRNSDALVRANIRLTLGKGWPVFVYADMGAANSVLKWQGLAGIRSGDGLDLLGGWRHVTYHFSPSGGFDSLDFDGPFLGATLAW
jgi:hypothetical protein